MSPPTDDEIRQILARANELARRDALNRAQPLVPEEVAAELDRREPSDEAYYQAKRAIKRAEPPIRPSPRTTAVAVFDEKTGERTVLPVRIEPKGTPADLARKLEPFQGPPQVVAEYPDANAHIASGYRPIKEPLGIEVYAALRVIPELVDAALLQARIAQVGKRWDKDNALRSIREAYIAAQDKTLPFTADQRKYIMRSLEYLRWAIENMDVKAQWADFAKLFKSFADNYDTIRLEITTEG